MGQRNLQRLIVADSGEVTQLTSLVTGVTLHTHHGKITTVAATTAAAAEEEFVVTNDAVGADSVVVACVATYGGSGTPIVEVSKVAKGSFTVLVANLHASAALDALMTINYLVLGAVR